ncbi:hypothetical protein [Acetobacter persici]|uniref:Uncharacterized protein n=1 Tax=Acetobacter persici TaxID=1076596 RepID=A0A1U9LJ83_9PROT|nr:hypothetical protein [Acetobacter persici]AQT06515.1 hypothetical protein A0U91_16030 [Acetobacter persici]
MAYAYSAGSGIFFNTNEFETTLILEAISTVFLKSSRENTWIAFLRRYVEQGEGISAQALAHMNAFLADEGCKTKQVTLRPTKVPYPGPGAKEQIAADRAKMMSHLNKLDDRKKNAFLLECRRKMQAEPETPEFDPTFDDQEVMFNEYKKMAKRLSSPKPRTLETLRSPTLKPATRKPILSLTGVTPAQLGKEDFTRQPDITKAEVLGSPAPIHLPQSNKNEVTAHPLFPHDVEDQPFIPEHVGWPSYEDEMPQPDVPAPKMRVRTQSAPTWPLPSRGWRGSPL